jgi:hypothetical protein
MKSWDKPKTEDMIAKFCGILRNGNLTDESMIQLEIGLKQIQEHLKALDNNSVLAVESDASQFVIEQDPSLAMALEFEYIPKFKKFI